MHPRFLSHTLEAATEAAEPAAEARVRHRDPLGKGDRYDDPKDSDYAPSDPDDDAGESDDEDDAPLTNRVRKSKSKKRTREAAAADNARVLKARKLALGGISKEAKRVAKEEVALQQFDLDDSDEEMEAINWRNDRAVVVQGLMDDDAWPPHDIEDMRNAFERQGVERRRLAAAGEED